ncbi:MAG: hypothetical protein IT453_18495 [Planctomycetes bacterium]|nr:hypothetical protein [Planctomycetota bacterium]
MRHAFAIVLLGALAFGQRAPTRIDPAALSAQVADATAEERVVLEPAALESLLGQALALDDDAFAALGGRELDRAAQAGLVGTPAEHRGELFRLRGTLIEMQSLADSERRTSYTRGRLVLESGLDAYFVAAELPLGIAAGDTVRCDAFFLKLYSRALDDKWLDAPLFVARKLSRSTARIEPVRELPSDVLASERDDTLADGGRELASDGLWHLLSYAANADPAAIDWERAPQLDAAQLARWRDDAGAERGRPVRIDSALLVHCDPVDPGENPLRWSSLHAGWLAPWSADDGVSLVQFVKAPADDPRAQRTSVSARGFFLRNVAYERENGEVALAPLVVLQTLEPAVTVTTSSWTWVLAIASGLFAALVAAFVILRRDARSSSSLRAELEHRARAVEPAKAGRT